ncbi:MAG TPA: NAD(P)-binding protein [Tepidisphaeraceae bacterium]|jgi:CPA2 family monovalent cation:H+ antiporter-2
MAASSEKDSLVIIAGYGLPGREAAQLLKNHQRPYCIIELNPTTVHRCEKGHVPIIEGSCTDPEILKKAGIEKAKTFIIAIPDEKAALESTAAARKLNPNIRILTRCHYTSAGIEAKARGADEVIVAEQVVAAEISKRIAEELGRPG